MSRALYSVAGAAAASTDKKTSFGAASAGAAASSVDKKTSGTRRTLFPLSDDDSLECHEIVDWKQINNVVQANKQQAASATATATGAPATAVSEYSEMLFSVEKMLFEKITNVENIYLYVETLQQQIAAFILTHSTNPQVAELTKIKKCLANFAYYLIFFYPLATAQKQMQLAGKYIQRFISGTLKDLSHVEMSFVAIENLHKITLVLDKYLSCLVIVTDPHSHTFSLATTGNITHYLKDVAHFLLNFCSMQEIEVYFLNMAICVERYVAVNSNKPEIFKLLTVSLRMLLKTQSSVYLNDEIFLRWYQWGTSIDSKIDFTVLNKDEAILLSSMKWIIPTAIPNSHWQQLKNKLLTTPNCTLTLDRRVPSLLFTAAPLQATVDDATKPEPATSTFNL